MKALFCCLVFFLAVLLLGGAAAATTYYVASDGNDNASGTLTNPWKTPQKAAAAAGAGDVIYLREGTYRVTARVGAFINFAHSGTSGSPITMAGYPGETAILNGMLDRSYSSYWTLHGGAIYYTDNLRGNGFDGKIAVVVQDGVALRPSDSLANLNAQGQTYFDSSMGRLYVWALGGGNPGLHTMELSQSDSIVQFDALDQYIVLDNLTITGGYYGIRCVPNGAHRIFRKLVLKHFTADAIKFNTTGNTDDLIEYCQFSSFGDFGVDTYGSSHQIIRYNEFTGVHAWQSGGAIKSLADGNHHLVEGNYIHALGGLGWEAAIELREAEYIDVINNLIVNVQGGGVNIYGDNSSLSTPVPDPTSIGITIVNNTFYHTKMPAIYLIQDCQDIGIKNNIVVQPSGDSSCLRVNSGTETGFASNHNDFVRTGGSPVRWLGSEYTLAQYQAKTRQDLASFSGDPLFVNIAAGDFHLKAGSPAIDRGDPSGAPALDLDRISRPQGAGIDLGAYEPAGPIISSFAINNGAETTLTRTVTLNNTCLNSPTHLMVSEYPSFSGAVWQAYSPNPDFTLSPNDETKTVYIKTKNGMGESAVLSDSISLTQDSETTPPQVVIITPQAQGSFSTSLPTIDMTGTVSAEAAIIAVLWNTDRGESGTAIGADEWQIDELPLHEGNNLVTVLAQDANGKQGTATLMVVYVIDHSGDTTTVQLQVSSAADDSYEKADNGKTTPNLSSSYVGRGYINGFRFRGVPVPPYAIITEARLWLNCTYYNTKPISICYVGEMTGNALPFTEVRYDISSRPRTDAEAADVPSSWVMGDYNTSPDLSSIMQEIVNQPEWREGNALTIIIQNRQSASGRGIISYDRNPALSAKLTITYHQP